MTNSLSKHLFSWVAFGGKMIGGFALVIATLLYFIQDKLLYIPYPAGLPRTPPENPPGFNAPDDWMTNGRMVHKQNSEKISFEESFVVTKDNIKLHTWLLLQPNSNEVPTLIYFHGNAGNMGFRLKNAAEMYAHVKINILMMDYRGYGSSEGKPNEKGLNIDAETVLNYALKHPKLKNSKMILFGRSLGGAVCFSLAHKFPDLVAGIIVENTFLSISAMVDHLMPLFKSVKSLVLRIKWDSDVKIQKIKQPIYFISGARDELVPTFHMKKLYELAVLSTKKVFYSVANGSHNDTWEVAGLDYYLKMKKFIDENITGQCDANNNNANKSSINEVTVESEDDENGSNTNNDKKHSNNNNEGGIVSPEGGGDSDDSDYLMVSKSQINIPTMNNNFQVK